MQCNTRDLTACELDAVSGGIAWVPAIAVAVSLFVGAKMADKVWDEVNGGGAVLTPQQIAAHLKNKGKPA